jgi:hypothetical protein
MTDFIDKRSPKIFYCGLFRLLVAIIGPKDDLSGGR